VAKKPQAIVALRPWLDGDHYLLERTVGEPAMTKHLGGPESADKLRESDARDPGRSDGYSGRHG
jgi:hypothetical protein